MKHATQQLSLWRPNQSGTTGKRTVYVAPCIEQLDQCAKQICRRLGYTVASQYDTAETRYELATFLKVVARMQAKYLNKQAQTGTAANRTQHKEGS